MATSPNPAPKTISALAGADAAGPDHAAWATGENSLCRRPGDRRGEPPVVVMGVRDLLKNTAPEKKVLAALRASASRNSTTGSACEKSIARFALTGRERSLQAPGRRSEPGRTPTRW